MRREQPEAGFTLIELLVVLVIMPLVIGAIAAAIIISEQDSGVASKTLSDSLSAQTTSAYYVRDVQGAQYVTTDASASNPVVCNPNAPNPPASSSTLVLGLWRPAGTFGTTTSTPLSVAYWVTGGPTPALVRDTCTVSAGTPSFGNELPISGDVDPAHVSAIITPSQFASGAKAGWTPTTPTTTVTGGTDLSTGQLQVLSTSGFENGQIGVRSTAGFQTPTCTVASSTSFSNCTGGSGTVANGVQVRQQSSISSITLSTTEPGSSYSYNLQATPRVWASRLSGALGPSAPFAAALVTLDGQPTSLTGGSITVDGTASFGGAVTATGASLSAQAAINTDGPITCSNGGTVTAGASSLCGATPATPTPTTDPIGAIVGGATPENLTLQGCPDWTGADTLQPGIYTCELNIPASEQVSLQPGVYELEAGFSVAAGATIQSIRDSNGDGALLYVTCPTSGPCPSPDEFQPGSALNILPLTASQSSTYFPAIGTPALQDVWLWQTSSDSAAASLVGNGPRGIAYLPAAVVDLSNNSGTSIGRIVAGNITMNGGSLTVTGQ